MQAGDLLTPSIRLVRPLARGGMGSVWLAEHLTLQTQIAVKLCLSEGPLPGHVAERFRREAALAFRVRSPYVVQVYDHGLTLDRVPYIAMELLQGEDLATRLRRLGPVDLLTFAKWLVQAAEGLSQAHAVGVVHRDIKPSNVFLCDEAGGIRVKLLDFGVAKNALRELAEETQQTAEGALLGTPAYMSPEQITNSRDVDFRSDLWSLAAVTYEAVTGERPFPGDPVSVLGSIARGSFLPPSQRRPGLPAALDVWAAKALAVKPARRYQSVAALASEFVKLVQHAHATSRRGSYVREWWRPVLMGVVVAGGVAGLTQILFGSGVVRRDTKETQPAALVPVPSSLQPQALSVPSALPLEAADSAASQHLVDGAASAAHTPVKSSAHAATETKPRGRDLPTQVRGKRPVRPVQLPAE
jgi:eukaryotic-like serine/threonine-protein kinase